MGYMSSGRVDRNGIVQIRVHIPIGYFISSRIITYSRSERHLLNRIRDETVIN